MINAALIFFIAIYSPIMSHMFSDIVYNFYPFLSNCAWAVQEFPGCSAIILYFLTQLPISWRKKQPSLTFQPDNDLYLVSRDRDLVKTKHSVAHNHQFQLQRDGFALKSARLSASARSNSAWQTHKEQSIQINFSEVVDLNVVDLAHDHAQIDAISAMNSRALIDEYQKICTQSGKDAGFSYSQKVAASFLKFLSNSKGIKYQLKKTIPLVQIFQAYSYDCPARKIYDAFCGLLQIYSSKKSDAVFKHEQSRLLIYHVIIFVKWEMTFEETAQDTKDTIQSYLGALELMLQDLSVQDQHSSSSSMAISTSESHWPFLYETQKIFNSFLKKEQAIAYQGFKSSTLIYRDFFELIKRLPEKIYMLDLQFYVQNIFLKQFCLGFCHNLQHISVTSSDSASVLSFFDYLIAVDSVVYQQILADKCNNQHTRLYALLRSEIYDNVNRVLFRRNIDIFRKFSGNLNEQHIVIKKLICMDFFKSVQRISDKIFMPNLQDHVKNIFLKNFGLEIDHHVQHIPIAHDECDNQHTQPDPFPPSEICDNMNCLLLFQNITIFSKFSGNLNDQPIVNTDDVSTEKTNISRSRMCLMR